MYQESLKSKIRAKFREIAKGAELPKNIQFYAGEDEHTVVLELQPRAIGAAPKENWNMQTDDAAFEAWALLIHTHCDFIHRVALTMSPMPGNLPYRGHYGRFVYRVMKFHEQFAEWFSLSPELEGIVEEFQAYLAAHRFCNNVPSGEAGENDHMENKIEALFANEQAPLLANLCREHGLMLEEPCQFFRQLPVGLFEEQVSAETRVFTGGKSAIDLWTTAGEDIVLFELKVDNAKVGILSEIMFYANYLMDMFIAQNTFNPKEPHAKEKTYRGYERLFSNSFCRVHGVMLTNGLHSLITPKVLLEMNQNAGPIRYYDLRYAQKLQLTEGCP